MQKQYLFIFGILLFAGIAFAAPGFDENRSLTPQEVRTIIPTEINFQCRYENARMLSIGPTVYTSCLTMIRETEPSINYRVSRKLITSTISTFAWRKCLASSPQNCYFYLENFAVQNTRRFREQFRKDINGTINQLRTLDLPNAFEPSTVLINDSELNR